MKHLSELPLGCGYTTGTCAQAAAQGACSMLIGQKLIKNVKVVTPFGIQLCLPLINQEIGKGFAQCGVVKDSGDDIDVTDNAEIRAKVRFVKKSGIVIKGGQGVGRVTKPGLAVVPGDWAINPVPRRAIFQEASKFLPVDKGLEVTISVPKGQELAKKTFNPRLGIAGGISIIGTTGIVQPKSLDAYKACLALELNVLRANGVKKVIFVLGYVGEAFCTKRFKSRKNSIIKIGDHVGFMLDESVKRGMQEVLLIGHIGKLIKITAGQFNTHYSFGDNRIAPIARYAIASGAEAGIVKKILCQKTAESAILILNKAGLAKVFDQVAMDVSRKCQEYANNKLKVKCVILSLNGEILGKTYAIK